jgi:diguanylate cyclase (GGDEF)-like protein
MSWGMVRSRSLKLLPAAIRSRMSGVLTAGSSFLIPSSMALIFLALIAVAGTTWQLRSTTLDEAQRELANLAMVLGEQTARSVQAIDIVIRDLHDDIVKMDIETPAAFGKVLGTDEIHRMLKSRLARLPYADAISLFDAAGKLINSSRQWPPPEIDISAREHYQHFEARDDPNPYIGVPVHNKISGAWTVYLVRRINAADGRFIGLALGAVKIEQFAQIFSSINLPRQEAFTLVRRDGTILVRHPDAIQRAGQVIPKQSQWYSVVAKGGGRFTSADDIDGIPRMVAVQPVRDYPLVVNVAVTEGAVLAEWRREALFVGFGTAVVFGFALYLMWRVHSQFRRLAQKNKELIDLSEELKSSQWHLKEKSHALETTLTTMDQGLMMIDASQSVVICNKRAAELLDLPADWMATRPHFIDVLKHQWQINKSGRDEGSFEEFARARMVLNRPHSQELRRPNGRVLEVRSIPLCDGGAVRTYTDISARKIAEERTRHVAHHDGLTGLVNRRVFNERLQEATMLATIDPQALAVLYLDLDRFKQVNDTRGHEVGDRLLAEATQRMKSVTRPSDTLARIGGDEFAIIVPSLASPDNAAHLARRLISALARPFIIDEAAATVGASVGIALFPQDGSTVDALLRSADEALYEAKRSGRNTFRFSKDKSCESSATSSTPVQLFGNPA